MARTLSSLIGRAASSLLALFLLLTPQGATAGAGNVDGFFGVGGVQFYGYAQDDLRAMAAQSDGSFILGGIGSRDGTFFLLASRILPNGAGDPAFGPSGTGNVAIPLAYPNPDIAAVLVDASGAYTFVGTPNGADVLFVRLDTTGALDNTFGTAGARVVSLAAPVKPRAAQLDASGRMVVAGEVTLLAGSQMELAVARFLADGTLDSTFGVNGARTTAFGFPFAKLGAMRLDAAGKSVLAGACGPVADTQICVARVDGNGNVDPTFNAGVSPGVFTFDGSGTSESANAMDFDAGGRIILAGNSDNIPLVVRLQSDGAIDTTFNAPNGHELYVTVAPTVVTAVNVMPGGRILFTGVYGFGVAEDLAEALILPNGGLDTSFGINPGFDLNEYGGRGILRPAASVIAGANQFTAFTTGNPGALAWAMRKRDAATLQLDQCCFNPYTDTLIAPGRSNAIAPHQGGYVVAGTAAPEGGPTRFEVGRLATSGLLDPGFGTQGRVWLGLPGAAYGVAIDSSDRILLAGQSGSQIGLIRLFAGGTPDAGFGLGGTLLVNPTGETSAARAVAYQPDGKILLAGWATVGGISRAMVVRLLANGSLDTSFAGGSGFALIAGGDSSELRALALQPDGRIVVAGTNRVGGTDNVLVARYDTTGAPDATFGTGGTTIYALGPLDNRANAVALMPDGRIVVGGTVNNSGSFQALVIRLRADGIPDSPFESNAIVLSYSTGNEVNGIAVQPNGRIVVVGQENVYISFTARFLPNTLALDPSWGTGGIAEYNYVSMTGVILDAGTDNAVVAIEGPGHESGAARFLAVGPPDLVVAISGPASFAAGSSGTYTITITNITGAPISGLTFTSAAFGAGIVNAAGPMTDCPAIATGPVGSNTVALSGTGPPLADLASCTVLVSLTSPVAASGALSIAAGTITANTGPTNAFGASFPIIVSGSDTTPDAFSFASVSNAALGSVQTSNPATITGIDSPAPISVSGGTYSIGCAGPYDIVPSTIVNGQTVCVRHTQSFAPGGSVTTTLTIGGVSATFTSTGVNLPSAPLSVSASAAANGSVTVAFLPPASDGGSPILSYEAVPSGPYASAIVAASPAIVTGLPPGGVFTFTVRASNAAGAGPDSLPSNAVTIAGIAASVAPSAGSGQSSAMGQAFATPLSVIVRDGANFPLAGVPVNFTKPAFAPTATLSSASAVTNASGIATVTATAAGYFGTYAVTATVAGLPPVTFTLTNLGSDAAVTLTQIGFGNKDINVTWPAPPVTLTNIGNAAMTIASIGVSGVGFTMSHNCPATIAPAGNCTINIAFLTSVEGPRTGAVTINSSGAFSPNAILLAGNGIDLTNPLGDADGDGVPNGVEASVNLDPRNKDNDVFNSARLFAMQQYRDFLGREGDAGGIEYYITLLNTGAATRANIIESFFNSPEFQGVGSPVARLYFATFLRIPDYPGLIFQINVFRAGTPLAVIANNFTLSPEFTQRYGSITNTQYVVLLYQNILGRTPAQAEIDFHVARLTAGATRGDVLVGFSESPEYQANTAHDVYVTMMYVGMLRRAPEQAGFDYWTNYMDAGSSGLALISGFLNAPEYHNRFLP